MINPIYFRLLGKVVLFNWIQNKQNYLPIWVILSISVCVYGGWGERKYSAWNIIFMVTETSVSFQINSHSRVLAAVPQADENEYEKRKQINKGVGCHLTVVIP